MQPLLQEIDSFYDYTVESLLDGYNIRHNNWSKNMDYDQVVKIDDKYRKSAIDLIESTYAKLTNNLVVAANNTIPKMGRCTLKHWWNDELEILKKRAWESNNEWILAGAPKTGILADIKKSDKYAYKLAIRKFKQAEASGITDSLLESLAQKDQNSFWNVWKSKLGISKVLPKAVDGECEQQVIADNFAKYFSTVCTSNSESRSKQLQEEYNNMKSNYKRIFNIKNCLMSAEEVNDLIKNLKKGKSPGLDNLTAEHLCNSHPIVAQLLAKLFNLMIVFEYVPNDFGKGILIPIPKNTTVKGDVTTENYRGISLNPVISKLFERCLLNIFDKYLGSSAMQFGFKSKSSCSHAVYSVRKAIEFFVERQSTVNVCGLDLAKAFDKVNRYGLFIKLMKRRCPVALINILECWFSKVYACVRWGECISDFVSLSCGTRQGGVASPILFAICVNDIIGKLQQSELGCHIHYVSFNAFIYADDLLLLATSLEDMQKMIDMCKAELDWLDMKINASKSGCIRIGMCFDKQVSTLCINNDPIKWVSELQYLGLVIKSGKTFKCCFHEKKVKFYRSVNGILGKLGASPNVSVILSLIYTNCNPILFYGLESLKLTKTDISALSHPYNSAYMKLFQSFNKNIITLCQYYCGDLPFEQLLHIRTMNFYVKLIALDSSPASLLFKWFGKRDFDEIAGKYNILLTDQPCTIRDKIQALFNELVRNLPSN